jgi:hypothetical protein
MEKPTLRLWTGRGKQTTVFHPLPTSSVNTSAFPHIHSFDDEFFLFFKTKNAMHFNLRKGVILYAIILLTKTATFCTKLASVASHHQGGRFHSETTGRFHRNTHYGFVNSFTLHFPCEKFSNDKE